MGESIYSKLYSIYAENMPEDQRIINRELFLLSVQPNANCIDLKPLWGINSDDFLDTAYVLLLQRLPDMTAKEDWMVARSSEDLEVCKKNLIQRILSSQEFKDYGKTVKNNIYLRKNEYSYVSLGNKNWRIFKFPIFGKLFKWCWYAIHIIRNIDRLTTNVSTLICQNGDLAQELQIQKIQLQEQAEMIAQLKAEMEK